MKEIQLFNMGIVGPNRMMNELMASYLQQGSGVQWSIAQTPSKLSMKKTSNGDQRKWIILWDCQGKDKLEVLHDFTQQFPNGSVKDQVAFFNVKPDIGLELTAIALGIWGFFYLGDSLDTVQNGVEYITRGEFWISRHFLNEYVLHNRPCNLDRQLKMPQKITDREWEILKLIQSGFTNLVIADRLSISPGTVRAHIYNLFKKIGASNRSQAAIWAGVYLQGDNPVEGGI